MKIRARRMHNRGRLLIVGRVDYPHTEVLDIVETAMDMLDCPSHTEVHVKGTERARPCGMAYGGIPSISNVAPSARWLVSLRIPYSGSHELPRRNQCYPRKETSSAPWPRYDVHTWQEDVFRIAAHEARHIVQFGEGGRRGEMDAERRAVAALNRWKNA